MRVALWLAWRELLSRRGSFAAGVIVIAVAVGLSTATELLLRARDTAMASQLDAVAADILILSRDKSASDLARLNVEGPLISAERDAQVVRQVSGQVRRVDRRLLRVVKVHGRSATLVGVNAPHVAAQIEAGHVAVGSELAQSLGVSAGDELHLEGRAVVASVLPPAGGLDDTSLFAPMAFVEPLAGAGGVSTMGLFVRPGVRAEDLATTLRQAHPELTITLPTRGAKAEREMAAGLSTERWAVYVATGAVIAICMLAWSFLNATERGNEMLLLLSVGGITSLVLLLQSTRAVIVAVVGAIAGNLIGLLVVLAQGVGPSALDVRATVVPVAALLFGAVFVSILGALPAGILAASRAGEAASGLGAQ